MQSIQESIKSRIASLCAYPGTVWNKYEVENPQRAATMRFVSGAAAILLFVFLPLWSGYQTFPIPSDFIEQRAKFDALSSSIKEPSWVVDYLILYGNSIVTFVFDMQTRQIELIARNSVLSNLELWGYGVMRCIVAPAVTLFLDTVLVYLAAIAAFLHLLILDLSAIPSFAYQLYTSLVRSYLYSFMFQCFFISIRLARETYRHSISALLVDTARLTQMSTTSSFAVSN